MRLTCLSGRSSTVVRPSADAATLYGPQATALAVKGALATPLAFVTTVVVVVELLKRTLAPDAGAVKLTLTPETGLLPASFTVTPGGTAKAVDTVAD